jgi:DNA-binding NarL/FixJ family response regulator
MTTLQQTGRHCIDSDGIDDERPLVSAIIVSDDLFFREGLGTVLRKYSRIDVIATLPYGDHSVTLTELRLPKLVILDISGSLREALRQLAVFARFSSDCRLVCLGVRDEMSFAREMVGQGASGYLLRHIRHQHLVSAINTIDDIPDSIITVLSNRTSERYGTYSYNVLTSREQQVITLAGKACTNLQIAHRLGISEGTVKRHMSSIFAKLDAVSRVDAINKYARLNSPA